MRRDRLEELLLLIIAGCMLSFLWPPSLVRSVAAMLILAGALIGVLVLRSISWHAGRTTPYDTLLVIGVIASVLYLLMMGALQRSGLDSLLVLLFSLFFVLIAVLVWHYRTRHAAAIRRAWPGAAVPTGFARTPRHAASSGGHAAHDRAAPAHSPPFRAGLEPIPERAPPHKRLAHHVRQIFRREPAHEGASARSPYAAEQPRPRRVRAFLRKVFRRGMQPLPEKTVPATKLADHHLTAERKEHIRGELFKRGMEPIHEMLPPRPAKVHPLAFSKGVEPIKEVKEPTPGKRHTARFKEGIDPLAPLSDAQLRRIAREARKGKR